MKPAPTAMGMARHSGTVYFHSNDGERHSRCYARSAMEAAVSSSARARVEDHPREANLVGHSSLLTPKFVALPDPAL